MPELGKGRCGCSFFYAVINFKEEQMENIIDAFHFKAIGKLK